MRKNVICTERDEKRTDFFVASGEQTSCSNNRQSDAASPRFPPIFGCYSCWGRHYSTGPQDTARGPPLKPFGRGWWRGLWGAEVTITAAVLNDKV